MLMVFSRRKRCPSQGVGPSVAHHRLPLKAPQRQKSRTEPLPPALAAPLPVRRTGEAKHALVFSRRKRCPSQGGGTSVAHHRFPRAPEKIGASAPAPAPSAACPAGTHLDEQKLVHILALRGAPVLALVAAPGHEIDTLRAGADAARQNSGPAAHGASERRSFLGG